MIIVYLQYHWLSMIMVLKSDFSSYTLLFIRQGNLFGQ